MVRAGVRVRGVVGQCENLSTPEPLGVLRDVAVALGDDLPELLARGAPILGFSTLSCDIWARFRPRF